MPTIPEFYTELVLDVACEDQPIIVPTKQYDNLTRHLRIGMYDSRTGDSVDIDSSLSAQLRVRRPDGVLVVLEAEINSSDQVLATLTESCLKIAGKALVDVKVFQGQKVFSAASFALDIQQTATGTYSAASGILTKANLEAINKSDFEALEYKDVNTLYVVVDGASASLYWGEIPISGTGASYISSSAEPIQDSSSTTGITAQISSYIDYNPS